MQRYNVGDEVNAFGRGRGVILAVAKPGQNIEDICRPMMTHMARLSMQGKRVSLPKVDGTDRFKGALTHYLVETEGRLDWMPWHLTQRVAQRQDANPYAAMPWAVTAPQFVADRMHLDADEPLAA